MMSGDGTFVFAHVAIVLRAMPIMEVAQLLFYYCSNHGFSTFGNPGVLGLRLPETFTCLC